MDSQNSTSAEQTASQIQTQQQPIEPASKNKRRKFGCLTFILLAILLWLIAIPTRILINKNSGGGTWEHMLHQILHPGLTALGNISDNRNLKEAAYRNEKIINIYKRGRNEIKQEAKLHSAYQKLQLAVSDNKDIDRNYVIESNASNLKLADKKYSEAEFAIQRLKRGDFSNSIGKVGFAIRNIDSLIRKIDMETTARKRKKIVMSIAERRKDNSQLLLNTVMKVNNGYTYVVDTFGLNRKSNGALGILSVNGYYKFSPDKFPQVALSHLKQLGFTENKKENDDFVLYFLKSDNGAGDKYYINSDFFDFSILKQTLGYTNSNGMVWCSYVILNFAHTQRAGYKIHCTRLYLTRRNRTIILVADMRPEKWTKWTFSDYNIASHVPELLLSKPWYTISEPVISSVYNPIKLPVRHVNIEHTIIKNQAKKIVRKDGEATAALPQVPILSLAIPNSPAPAAEIQHSPRRGPSVVNTATIQAERRKAERLEAAKRYIDACKIYVRLANAGDYYSMEKIIRLLYLNKVFFKQNGKLLNYYAINNWALKMIKAPDASIKRKGYYYLGLIRIKGGAGISKNTDNARKFLQLAAQSGHTQATQILKGL